MVGSGVWCGAFSLSWAYVSIHQKLLLFECRLYRHDRSDLSGNKLGDELKRIGYLGSTPAAYDANKLSAHFEVHIEQGPILEAKDLPVAVVTGVQGSSL